jgi:hypothetical protein
MMATRRSAVGDGVSNFLRQTKGRALPSQGTGGREGEGAGLLEQQDPPASPPATAPATRPSEVAVTRASGGEFGQDIIERALTSVSKAPRTKSLTVRLTERDFYRLKVLSLATGQTILDIGEGAILEWMRRQERRRSEESGG